LLVVIVGLLSYNTLPHIVEWPNQFSKVTGIDLLIAKIFTHERINALIAALVLIGIALLLVGIWRYVDAGQRLTGNEAQAIQTGDASLNIQTPEQAQGLIAADVQRRRLERQQNESLIMAGVGLALLALGWLGYDLVRTRRKSRADALASPAKESS
jgi:uncharacterized membrane protein YidH (DUF202 family)